MDRERSISGQHRTDMLSKHLLEHTFAGNGIFVKQRSEGRDVKGELSVLLGEQNGWLVQCVCETDFIEDVSVRGSYLCDHDLRVCYRTVDICHDKARTAYFVNA